MFSGEDDQNIFQLRELILSDVARKLRKFGVKEVHLDVGLLAPTFNQIESEACGAKFRDFFRGFSGLWSKDEPRDRILSESRKNAKLIVKTDRRYPIFGEEDITDFAIDAFHCDEDWVRIKTPQGWYHRGNMSHRNVVQLERFGNSVLHTEMWKEMRQYYRELRDNGSLEE